MAKTIFSLSMVLGTLAVITAVLYKPLALRYEVLGAGRSLQPIENIHGRETRVIPGTWYAEDLHHHRPSNLLFAASEANMENRWKWMPPMGYFDDPTALGHGSIVVIDPATLKSTRLKLTNFSGPFVTHGIDIFSSEDDPNSVYIYAVNHLPSEAYLNDRKTKQPKAQSRIEVFYHVIGTTEAKHLRSIWHPLIRTPNDIYAENAHSIYITNDHYYREGVMKLLEDVAFQNLAPWTDLVHVEIFDLEAEDDTTSLTATVAIKGIHNNNGLGHGRQEDEILIVGSASGVLVRAEPSNPYPTLKVTQRIQLPSVLDNPSYFQDPYAEQTGRDASGYVLAGLATALSFPGEKDPVMVWLVHPTSRDDQNNTADFQSVTRMREKLSSKTMGHKLIFQDDGSTISSASTAVLVAIDPKENEGLKQAWLFVTGPVAASVIASKIDL